MTRLIVPRHVALEERRRKDGDSVAETIKNTARHRLDSDDWATVEDVAEQLAQLSLYLDDRRETEPGYVLPTPVGWKVMVLMLTIPEKTQGGVIVIDDAKEQRALASPQGVVLAMGPASYTDPDRFTVRGEVVPWIDVGDRATFVKYDAAVFQISNGQRLGFLQDTQPVAVIDKGWEIPK